LFEKIGDFLRKVEPVMNLGASVQESAIGSVARYFRQNET
jgi:hypothetical protein